MRRKYVLFSFVTALVALNGTLLLRSDRPDLLGLVGLFAIASGYLLWEKRTTLNRQSDGCSAASGLLILLWIWFKSWHFNEDEAFLRCLPLFSLISCGLMISGWRSWRNYGAGLLLFGFLACPWELLYGVADLSLWTAWFADGVLQVLGFAVQRQGTLIRLGAGAIEVYHGCSGLRLILQLLSLSLLYFVLIPLDWRRRWFIVMVAIAVGFVMNGVRVALMAILSALGDELAFYYWHLGTGSLIFSGLSVMILGGCCWAIQAIAPRDYE